MLQSGTAIKIHVLATGSMEEYGMHMVKCTIVNVLLRISRQEDKPFVS